MFDFKEGNYEDYIKYNGLKGKQLPIYEEIKKGNAKYYIVFNNNEYFSEFLIFLTEDNLLNLNITDKANKFIEEAFKYLKEKYEYLTIRTDQSLYDYADLIRKKYICISEKKLDFGISSVNVVDIKIKLK